MKWLHIQIQPDRVAQLDLEAAIQELKQLGANGKLTSKVRVRKGNDDGRYVNVDWATKDCRLLWKRLQDKLKAEPKLARCTIVCSQGKNGWDDYLLLHHYDGRIKLDHVE